LRRGGDQGESEKKARSEEVIPKWELRQCTQVVKRGQ